MQGQDSEPTAKPIVALATPPVQRHPYAGMDCDDCILLLAHPDHESVEVSAHLASCESCRQLADELGQPDEQPAQDGDAVDDLIGTVVGAYEIRELIGSGGMGRVYMARHPTIGSRVAIKVFSKDWNEHPSLVSRFFAEAHATNVIAHENIVNVLDVGRLDDGRPFLIMEFLLGAPLSKLVGTESLNDSALTQIILDVLSALAAAHEHQIVHRDLKPDNIFVSPEGRATLLDFGIAKLMPEVGADSAPTATGTVLGTPHYMSPEQAVGDPVDTRTDVYAMGVILYECFTGKRPFTGGSLYRLMDQHVNHIPRSPRAIRPDLGADVETVILKALEKSPSDRYASTGEMRASLEACECSPTSGAFLLKTGPIPDSVETRVESGSTAATVASRPSTPTPAPEPEPEPEPVLASNPALARVRWAVPALVGVGLLAGAGLWLRGSVGQGDAPGDAAVAVVAVDPTPTKPFAHTAVPGRWDAAIPPAWDAAPAVVASRKDLRPRRPRARKVAGTAPLSLLAAATEAAHQNQPDAVLSGVRLEGLNRDGRVLLGNGNGAIIFDFLSAKMATRVAERGRERGGCVVRVTYRGLSNPEVKQVGAKCGSVRMLPRPSCSQAKLIMQATKSGDIPADGQMTGAVLQMSRGSGRPTAFWKFTIAGRGYNTPSC